jgi:hypothetical protein
MNRREFLLLKPGRENHSAEISCERLYMRFLDSQMDGTTASLLTNLDEDLRHVEILHLTDSSWLSSEDLKQKLNPILTSFRSRGGTIEFL